MDGMELKRNKLLLYEEALWLAPFMLVNLFVFSELPYLVEQTNIELFSNLYSFSPIIQTTILVALSGVITSLPLSVIFSYIFSRRLFAYSIIAFSPSVALEIYSINEIFPLAGALLGVLFSFIIFIIVSVAADRYVGDSGPMKTNVKRLPTGFRKIIFVLGSLFACLGLCFLIVTTVAVAHGESNNLPVTLLSILLFIVSSIAYVYTKPA